MQSVIKNRFASLLSIGVLSLLVFSACKEEEVAIGDPSIVSFAQSNDISNEGESTIKILLTLDKPQNTETVVHFKVEGNATPGTTNSDYELLSDSPLVFKKNETQVAIEIMLAEDKIFEQHLENIIISIDDVLEGNAILNPVRQKLIHIHEIEENDYQLFLEWESDQKADLNMFIELPNKNLLSANSSGGFEEITMTNVKDQERYYIDVWHNGGESQVSYQIKTLSAGEEDKKILVNSSFDPVHGSKSSDSSEESTYQNFLMIKEGRELKVLK